MPASFDPDTGNLLQMEMNPLLETEGLPSFSAIKPEHIEPAAREVLDDNRRALEALLTDAESRHADFETDILALENLADRLHRVWSPVAHLHAVTNSPDLREAYNNCLPELARYQTEIAQDERLYRLYEQVAETLANDGSHKEGDDGPEAIRNLLRLALRDFHLAGVDLPDERKQRFKSIMEELTQLQATFEQNVLDSMAAWQHLEPDEKNLAGIPATMLEQAASNAREAGEKGCCRYEMRIRMRWNVLRTTRRSTRSESAL